MKLHLQQFYHCCKSAKNTLTNICMCQVVESMCFNQMIFAFSWAWTVKVKRFNASTMRDVSIFEQHINQLVSHMHFVSAKKWCALKYIVADGNLAKFRLKNKWYFTCVTVSTESNEMDFENQTMLQPDKLMTKINGSVCRHQMILWRQTKCFE